MCEEKHVCYYQTFAFGVINLRYVRLPYYWGTCWLCDVNNTTTYQVREVEEWRKKASNKVL